MTDSTPTAEAVARIRALDDMYDLAQAYPENPKANSMDLLCNDLELVLAAFDAMAEALRVLIMEANRLGPQLPYNAPTKDIAAAIEDARQALALLAPAREG